ncbi:MAG: hypothetical protein ACOYXR_03380 [Nitrospirota bacterium]
MFESRISQPERQLLDSVVGLEVSDVIVPLAHQARVSVRFDTVTVPISQSWYLLLLSDDRMVSFFPKDVSIPIAECHVESFRVGVGLEELFPVRRKWPGGPFLEWQSLLALVRLPQGPITSYNVISTESALRDETHRELASVLEDVGVVFQFNGNRTVTFHIDPKLPGSIVLQLDSVEPSNHALERTRK